MRYPSLAPILLAVALQMSRPALAQEGDAIGLYIHRLSRNWTNYRQYELHNFTGRPTDCAAACDGLLADDCLPQYIYWPENVCIRDDRNAPSSIYRKTTNPDKIADGFAMERCYFDDDKCQVPDGGECQGYIVDTCADSGQEIMYFEDWCVLSTEPRGDYIVPLATQRSYSALNTDDPMDCATADYQEIFGPVDPQLCHVSRVRKNNQFLLGSLTLSCNANGTLTVERWEDSQCSGPKEDLDTPMNTIPSSCPESGVIEARDVHQYVVNCNTPTVFCKDLALVLPSINRLESTNSPSSPPASDLSGVGSVGASNLLLVFVAAVVCMT